MLYYAECVGLQNSLFGEKIGYYLLVAKLILTLIKYITASHFYLVIHILLVKYNDLYGAASI